MTRVVEAPLPEFFEFIRNGMSVKQDKDGAGLPITRIETIANGTIDENRFGYAGLQKAEGTKWLLKRGDILFSHINSVDHIGKCAIFESDREVIHGMNLLCFRPKSDKIDPYYIKWLFRSAQFRSQIMPFVNKAVNQASISIGNLSGILIRMPPLNEQRRVAAILDQADELRRKRQRAIDRLNQLGQAIFSEMFGDATANPMGWPVAKLGDIVRPGDKINYGVVQPGEEVEAGVPLVRVGDLLSGFIDPTKIKHIDASVEANYKRSRLNGDEILIGCVGSIGTVALAHEGLRGANIARAVARVPIDADIAVRDFISEQIKSPLVQRYFTAETRTVAQPTLNIGLIVGAPIILPPVSEQAKFAEAMTAVRQNHKYSGDCAAKIDCLFSSLQHRAFRGEL